MKNREYQICTNCVMDTTDSKITFDENGVCDHCQTFYKDIKPNWHTDEKGFEKISKIVEDIKEKAKGKKYDCLIGMSGGIDSSYLLYLAKEKLGLNPLVFHIDGGWNTEESTHNVKVIVEKLGLKLHTEIIDWEEMRDVQLSFFKSGVPHIDTAQDHAFFAVMYKFALKYDIKYILTGGNYSTECIRNPIEWMYYQSDSIQLKDIHSKFGTIPLKKYPTTNILWHKIYLPYIKKIKLIRPLDYFPYYKDEATQFLVDYFGYKKYPQKHFESVFTRFYEGYWLPTKFGFDTRKVQFSSLIVTEQMSREDALEKLKTPVYTEEMIKRDMELISKKLNISEEELLGYMNAPNKSYKDYKNQMSIYNIGAKVLRFFGIEKGGKR
ncbi:N-acetyl sugar amidotransferase [Aliarcobacter skirrowii]|uniref:N-acetyl sugar amidotransferase n=1 Tax=Aliarcobacter skirrowii TaxID=28200 RepID=UPI0029A6E704|nr:N-acetyl sugar amidotransferase [Aliarcobacter skirrowii]MDX4050876.1 N-acetyl sugar amidotransferase [Aliarcobacter skirrowii]